MNTKLLRSLLIIISALFLNLGCQKFLDHKPRISDVVPNNLEDLQRLLDNVVLNSGSPGLLELVADNYYVTTDRWQTRMSSSIENARSEALHYIWDANAIPHVGSWQNPYQNPIYYSNIVLDQLPEIDTKQGEEGLYNQVRGSALFYRAFAFYQLAQLFCKPYATANASTEDGIILKLTSNVNENLERSTVQQTYERILTDLEEAASLLPTNTPFPTRPTKAAAYAKLARAYLSMRNYDKAGEYANLALEQNHQLMDFNTLVPVHSPPVATFNPEVVYHNYSGSTPTILGSSYVRIDSNLYKSYDSNDLRKQVFFRQNTGSSNAGTYNFRGSYHGSQSVGIVFDGLTTGELYLIRAECFARDGKIDLAMNDLNTLLLQRWKIGSFIPLTSTDQDEALSLVLTERRKELIFRGLRWTDIRRLNLEGANITLSRLIGGITYTLPPNDLRTAMLIPWDEINRSGISQNTR